MVWCITKLRPYLYGQLFTLMTDHHPLCWLNKRSSKNGRLDRWSLQLQEYSFVIKHTPGPSNCVADCLSRYPTTQPDDITEEQLDTMHGQLSAVTSPNSSSFDVKKLLEKQQQDGSTRKIYDHLANGKQRQGYVVRDGIVHKLVQRRGQQGLELPYVPATMINDLLHAYHDSPVSGHLGVNKTWSRIQDRYFWPGMFNNIKAYVLSCTQCQKFKINRQRPVGKLQPIEPPTGIWELIGLDFVGPVPQSSSGNKYILVCTDYLSKYAVTQAVPNCTADTAARFLVEKAILQYGVPKQVITDRGTHFMASVFQAVAARCGCAHTTTTTTTNHPQCNELTERFNATLVGSISTYVNQQQSD